jgi:hypothetical protein
MKIINLIKQICIESQKLKSKYIKENNLVADWVCIFSQDDMQYSDLLTQASRIGKQIEGTDSGLVFKLTAKINTQLGIPKVLKIRRPDITRPELGDVDLTTDYNKFKKKYMTNDHFKLIVREKFEMIELMDSGFNTRLYFSSIPPSKLRGIK